MKEGLEIGRVSGLTGGAWPISNLAVYDPPATPGLASDAELILGQKRFWRKSVWFSIAVLALPILFSILGLTAVAALMGGGGPARGHEDAAHYSVMASFVALTAVVTVCPLALLWLIFSLVRYRALPKTVP